MTKRILFLAANPVTTAHLQLQKELREIKTALQASKYRDQLDLRYEGAIRPKDLAKVIPEYEPHIIHFSGHGEGEQGLMLEDDNGHTRFVDANNLARLFKLFSKQVECVVLNACYSEVQAEAIRRHIDFVVGMTDSIGDHAAIDFAISFYNALGAGQSYEAAYELSCFGLSGTKQEHVPTLKKKPLYGSTASLWIHGWASKPYSNSPHIELDWTKHFDIDSKPNRRIADQATWDATLYPELLEARNQITQNYHALTIELRGLLPLSAAIAVGTVFPDTRGFTFQIEQRTTGQCHLWRTDALPSNAKFQPVDEGESGEHLLVFLAITGGAKAEAADFYKKGEPPFTSMIYAEPEQGTGEQAMRSDADAVALAIDAKQLIQRFREKYATTCIHLVVYGPQGFCVFLGHRLRMAGDVICYERVAVGRYVPSVHLQTG